MREFKFLTNKKRIYFEGREVVYVGYLIYNPTSFDPIRRVRLMDGDGRIDQEEIDADHPLWNEFVGMDYYII
jgi:hypothetical protein